MYKKVLFLVFGVLMFICTVAQNSVTVRHIHMQNAALKTIIREYPSHYPSTIACYNCDDSMIFVYYANVLPNQVTEIAFDNYWVNDFVINGDMVYFCGRSILTRSGIFGYFRIPDAFLSGVHEDITVIPIKYTGNGELCVKELTRITSYYDADNTLHLACIGTTTGKYNYPCLVTMDTGSNIQSYCSGYIPNPNETFTDIKVVLTQNQEPYLVTVGIDTTRGSYMNIRVYNPSNVFDPLGIQNKCHIYCVDTAAVRPWLKGSVMLTDIGNGIFLTTSYRRAPIERDTHVVDVRDFANIHIGKFSLDQIIADSTSAMLDNYEIPLLQSSHREMNEIIYSSISQSAVFLHSYVKQNEIISDFCEFMPNNLQNSDTLTAHQKNGFKQQGLSLYNNGSNYILSGVKLSRLTELGYEMETFGHNPGCVSSKVYPYERKPVVKSINPILPFNIGFHAINSVNPQRFYCDYPLYIDCQQ